MGKRHYETVSNYLTHIRDSALARDGKILPREVTPLGHEIVLWNTEPPTPLFAFDDFVETSMPEFSKHYFENLNKYLTLLEDPGKADPPVRKEAAKFFRGLSNYVKGYEIKSHNALMEDADYSA